MNEKASEAAAENQQPQANGAAPPKGGGKKINKMEAVRRSVARLGMDAPLQEVQADLRKRFGVEMTAKHISTYKGDIRKKARAEAESNGATDDEAVVAAPAEPEKAAKPAAKGGNGSVEIDDLLALKGLVERVGAEPLRRLIAVFEG